MRSSGVAICESLRWHPRDFSLMKAKLSEADGLQVYSSPSLCDRVVEVSDFVRKSGVASLVVTGACDRAALGAAAKAAETAGIPRFAIQTVPLQLYHLKEDGSMGETWALSVVAHARKVASASFAASAKKTLNRDVRLGRRELLFSLPKLLGDPVEDPVMVPERCSPFHQTCRFCSDACSYSAITHEGPTARIDSSLCVHCGACAAACPSGALQPPVFSDDEYRALLREFATRSSKFENPLIVFTSDVGISMLEAEAKAGAGLEEGMVAVKAPWPAALGWSHYLWAASANVPVLGVCPAQEVARHPEAKAAAERAEAAVASLRGSYRTLVGYRILGASETISGACVQAANEAVRRLGASFVPPGPRRDAVLSVPQTVVTESEVRNNGLNAFDVSVNDKCTLCGTCANLCPTKAFRMVTKDGPELDFYPSQCTGCGICVKECPEDALEVSRAFSAPWLDYKTFRAKAHDTMEHCRKCGKEIGSKSSIKKLHDALAKEGTAALAETVYYCQDCKGRLSLDN